MAKKVGRQTKCTPELTKKICEEISKGAPIYAACQRNKLGQSTFFRWLERAEEEPQSVYREFMEAVKKADSELECKLAKTATEASLKRAEEKGDPIPIFIYLERRWFERWGKKTVMAGQVEHKHQHQHTHQLSVANLKELPPDRLQALIDELQDRDEPLQIETEVIEGKKEALVCGTCSHVFAVEEKKAKAKDIGEESVDADPQGPTTKKNLP